MANEKNLEAGKATQFRSGEEAVTAGRKGGLASAEARRRKKSFRETLKMLLECDIPEKRKAEALEKMGLAPTYMNQINIASVKKAAKGDLEAARFIRDTIGERPREGLEIGNLDDKPLTYTDMSRLTDEQLRAIVAQEEEKTE